MTDPAVEEAIGRLRACGERITVARRAVLEVLAGHAHLDADEVAERVAQLQPGVHRATIYRTLRSLVEQGVVSHTHVPDAATIYHLRQMRHAHLQCARCGRFADMPLEWLAPLAQRIDTELGFTLDADHAALLGLCADCRETPASQFE
ncbi:Fur family transcriptional regulator [Calidifontibacter terrae]